MGQETPSPRTVPSPRGSGSSSNIWFIVFAQVHKPIRHLVLFSHFCRGHGHTWYWVIFCDPVTRESSDPETQLTRWSCSIMNSKCRLMLRQTFAMGKMFASFYRCLAFARVWKVKFWGPFINVNISITVGRILTKKYIYLYIFYLGLFFENWKTLDLHQVNIMTRWPGCERWSKWQLTWWPNDPVPCLVMVVINRHTDRGHW